MPVTHIDILPATSVIVHALKAMFCALWPSWSALFFKVECSIGTVKQRKQFGEAHVARLILPDYLSNLFRDSLLKIVLP